MAWERSDRRRFLPKDWNKRRLRVLRRDGYRCQIAGPGCLVTATEVDHMGERTDHRLEVLQSVCRVCHKVKTAKQSAEARALRPTLRLARDPESHPGLIPPQE